jgi:hypothetical protein
MRRLKGPLTALLVLVVLIDVVVGFRLLVSGWPKRVGLASVEKGVEQVQVTPIPFTGADWLVLLLVISVHAMVLYLTWKAWHSSSVRV